MLEKELAPVIIGEDPFFTRQIRKKLWNVADYHGVEGLAHFGISAIYIALWDIVEANVNMLCAIPNAIYLESGSLRHENNMMVTQLKMVDGEVLLPDTPGMGTEVTEDFIKAHRIV